MSGSLSKIIWFSQSISWSLKSRICLYSPHLVLPVLMSDLWPMSRCLRVWPDSPMYLKLHFAYTWKEKDLTLHNQLLYGTCFTTVSCLKFGSGFVLSRIHTTELIFNQLLLSLDRSLKLIWIVFVTRNFSLTLQRLWCTQLQLDSNTFVFPKQDMQWTRKIFSASRLWQTLCFFFLERRETGRLPGENYMFVCAIILLFENRFIFLACLPQPAS